MNKKQKIVTHNTPILQIEYHCGLLIFFLSFEMSSKDPDEVDLFQQTWQVQEIAQRGEKDAAAAAKKALCPLPRNAAAVGGKCARKPKKTTTRIEMSLAFGLLKRRCPNPSDSKRIGRLTCHTLEVNWQQSFQW